MIQNRVATPRFSYLVLRHAWHQKAFHPSQPMFIQLIHVVPETSDVLIELYCFRPPCFAVEYVVVSIIIVNVSSFSSSRISKVVEGWTVPWRNVLLVQTYYTFSYQSLGKISISSTSHYEVYPVQYFNWKTLLIQVIKVTLSLRKPRSLLIKVFPVDVM